MNPNDPAPQQPLQQPAQPQPVVPQYGAPTPQQPMQPQPITQPGLPQQPPASNVPSSWNTLFILALIFDIIIPIIGLILGEVLFQQAKAGGNQVWRKKAMRAIYFGCLTFVVWTAIGFGSAAIRASHDTAQSSDDYWSKQASEPRGKNGNPSDTQAGLNLSAVETIIDQYDSNPHSLPTSQGGFLSYATLAQLQDKTWRTNNSITVDSSLFAPTSIGDTLMFISGTPTAYNQFGYVPHPSGCQNTAASPCTSYTITAKKSSGVITDKSYDYASND